MYAQDWDERLPPASKPNGPYFWVKPLDRGLYDEFWGMTVLCAIDRKGYDYPTSRKFVLDHPDKAFGYQADPDLAGMSLRDLDDCSATMFAWDSAPYFFGGRCCTFLDGHPKWLPEEEWRQALRRSKQIIAQSKRASRHDPRADRRR